MVLSFILSEQTIPFLPSFKSAVVEFVGLIVVFGVGFVFLQLHEAVREEQIVDENIQTRVVLVEKLVHLKQREDKMGYKTIEMRQSHKP